MKIGIIGVGKAGSLHLGVLDKLNYVKDVFLADTDPEKLSACPGRTAYSDYRELKDLIHAAIIATPTSEHFKIAEFFLENKIPVLVEKPLTADLKQARRLLELSGKNRTLLFTGHVERYNNAYMQAKKLMNKPKFIECHRLSMYPNRSLDISVILDLMIHDLDIILDITKDKVKKIEAVGVRVLSNHEDIVNARISFSKGCIANVTASRVSAERIRKFRVFSENSYISLNYLTQEVEIYKKTKTSIQKETVMIDKEEPLKKEIVEFLDQVKNKRFSLRDSTKAKDAVALALRIQKTLKNKTR